MATETKPDRFADPKGYALWELSQCSAERLAELRTEAVSKLAYLAKNHAIQRANHLNSPARQAEVERKNRAPHEWLISAIDIEIANR